MPMFDTYLMVDWSAAASPADWPPGSNAIWWAAVQDGHETVVAHEQTRSDAVAHITHFLNREADEGRRVMVGFDFAFGYPGGFVKRITGTARARSLWRHLDRVILDTETNANNRFVVAADLNERIRREYGVQGPFWGDPSKPERVPSRNPYKESDEWPFTSSDGKSDGKSFRRKRITEEKAHGTPATVWQLASGPNVVGSQVLMGLPWLYRLCERLNERCRGAGSGDWCAVWPFDTDLSIPTREEAPPIVIVEIYPSLLGQHLNAAKSSGEIMDRAQVRLTAAAFSRLDREGDRLRHVFSIENALSADDNRRRIVANEEGWILGVGYEEEMRGALDEARRDAKE